MNELSERSKRVAKLAYWKAFEYAERPDNGVLEIAKLIEQALLAERRLAMEEAAKIVEGRRDPDCICDACDECTAMAQQLRAAAEKEVVK